MQSTSHPANANLSFSKHRHAMISLSILRWPAYLTLLAAVVLNLYIYNYPYVQNRSECTWAETTKPPIQDHETVHMLAFGDPQIRGASNSTPWRTRLDIFGNDHFLGHIYRVMAKRTRPNHVTVLGDLLSSQWIRDDEFARRADRFAERIFDPSLVTANDDFVMWYNISGNHDIGYGGEMTRERIDRFEQRFGRVNYYLPRNGYRVVVLNNLALDGPVFEQQFQDDCWDFVDQVRQAREQDPSVSTILMTHVPLFKPKGICTDGPMFRYYDNEWAWIRSQNHISAESTNRLLDGIFGREDPRGVILAGHDHEGCVSSYSFDHEAGNWSVEGGTGNRVSEFTVRSMMGEFGGNTGLLTGQWNVSEGKYDFAYSLCPFVVQHLWWATKVVTIIATIVALPVAASIHFA